MLFCGRDVSGNLPPATVAHVNLCKFQPKGSRGLELQRNSRPKHDVLSRNAYSTYRAYTAF